MELFNTGFMFFGIFFIVMGLVLVTLGLISIIRPIWMLRLSDLLRTHQKIRYTDFSISVTRIGGFIYIIVGVFLFVKGVSII
jgi:uncharacterized membrane protein